MIHLQTTFNNIRTKETLKTIAPKKSLMSQCVFCKILSGELPCAKVNENKFCLAFLDINPATNGHVLCIPKKHYEFLTDVPEEELKELIIFTQKTGEAVQKAMNVNGFNILQSNHSDAGQVVPHVHFHIIPRKKGDMLSFEQSRKKLSQQELLSIAQKISGCI
jgi:histidine triad (HIT) family protein